VEGILTGTLSDWSKAVSAKLAISYRASLIKKHLLSTGRQNGSKSSEHNTVRTVQYDRYPTSKFCEDLSQLASSSSSSS
jgi:hypothetical protein